MRKPSPAVSGIASVWFLFSLTAFASAPSAHGGPAADPTFEFDSNSTVETYEGREQTLAPLDDVISAESRARIDAHRAKYQRSLELLSVRRDPVAQVASAVDLRFRDTPVKRQFGGTCTTFGLMAAMENQLGGQIELSERHFWSQYHQYSCEMALATASQSWGVVELDWWPTSHRYPWQGYLNQPWYKLARYEHLDGDIGRAIASLDTGNPVYVGVSTPTDMMNCPIHISADSGPYKNSGHALAIVGYELDPAAPGGGAFLLKNSWGTGCGDRGYQWYPFNLCAKAGMYCDFWSIQAVSHD